MIKNIIFDIGNVLVTFDPKGLLNSFGFSPEKSRKIALATFGGPLWQDLDRGLKPISQIREEMIALAPEYREDILEMFRRAGETILRRKEAIPWVKALKEQGYRVYYLSNYSDWLIELTRPALDFLPLMDGGLFSYEVKQIKPEPEIYLSFLERYPTVKPEESIFFDDSEKNVEAACKLRFHGIVFQNREQAMEAAGQLLFENR